MLHCFTQTAMVLGHCKTRWITMDQTWLKNVQNVYIKVCFKFIFLHQMAQIHGSQKIFSSLFNADRRKTAQHLACQGDSSFSSFGVKLELVAGEKLNKVGLQISKVYENPEEFEEYSTVEQNIYIYTYSHISYIIYYRIISYLQYRTIRIYLDIYICISCIFRRIHCIMYIRLLLYS